MENARRLCEELLRGTVSYDFVEVMACPGGCAGGGGQPFHSDDRERVAGCGQILSHIDGSMQLQCSHENPDITRLYEEFLKHPMSDRAEALLHTDHSAWKMPGEKGKEV